MRTRGVRLEASILLGILGLFVLLLLTGCNSTTAPMIEDDVPFEIEVPRIPPYGTSSQTEWEPVDYQLPDCDRPAELIDVVVALANAIYQNDRLWSQDTCCWVYRGRPAFRSNIMYGVDFEHNMFAHRVLRPEEWDGENKYMQFRSLVIVINAIIQEWNDPITDRCWRVFPVNERDGRYTESIYIGPRQAAPLNYRWTITLRHRPLADKRATHAPPDLIDSLHRAFLDGSVNEAALLGMTPESERF
jgi:hypothetical protein